MKNWIGILLFAALLAGCQEKEAEPVKVQIVWPEESLDEQIASKQRTLASLEEAIEHSQELKQQMLELGAVEKAAEVEEGLIESRRELEEQRRALAELKAQK